MRHAREAQSLGHRLTVEREAGSGDGAGAEGRDIGTSECVGEASAVPLEHLDIGQQMMREEHWLGWLHVGVPGHHRVAVCQRQLHQSVLQTDHGLVEARHAPAQPQAQVGRDLVVA